jgi:MoaA/NifB/PqqE/SkfB family radical SAM enzyme
MLGPLPRSKVMFNCTIVSQNVAHLRRVQQCADDLGVEITFTVPQLTDVYMANQRTPDRFALDDAERADVVGFLRERLERATGRSAMSRRYCAMLIGLLTEGERNIGCPLADGGLFLEPGGRALPCWRASTLETGNILVDGTAAVLKRRSEPAYREKLRGHCRTCSINCYVDWTRRMFALSASGGRLS